jgi:hypothetical protein
VPDQNELIELNRDLKARNSELSRDLGLAQRAIKSAQDEAASVKGLEDEIHNLKSELAVERAQNASLAKAAGDADLSASQVQKRADAFLAIREALSVK